KAEWRWGKRRTRRLLRPNGAPGRQGDESHGAGDASAELYPSPRQKIPFKYPVSSKPAPEAPSPPAGLCSPATFRRPAPRDAGNGTSPTPFPLGAFMSYPSRGSSSPEPAERSLKEVGRQHEDDVCFRGAGVRRPVRGWLRLQPPGPDRRQVGG